MKILQKILAWLSLILILGGAGVILFKYLTNKSLFSALLAEPMVRQSLGIIQVMLYGLAAVFIGLVLLTLAMKIGGSIRSKEKAEAKLRKAVEKEQEKAAQEAAEINARYQQQNKDAEEEAERILNI
jgi:Na+-transporting methylmalonyl-CoA/oxaloacetate decarboxylase gamma subunit